MHKHFIKTAKIALILVYLVIIAGAVVRMTGSGMGCPDWPKCFGHIIPPTNISELQWQPNSSFSQGQIIIVEETLQIANEDFISTSEFNKSNWSPYTKHDYATFNPIHTWIEYINRLFGALAGFATFILALLSLKSWKNNKPLTILSWAIVIAMGIQGWLGATVVYSVLNPVKITIHMVVALAIVSMLLYLIFKAKGSPTNTKKNRTVKNLLVIALLLTLVQIVLGTQVRQAVDEQIVLLGYNSKNLWLAQEDLMFYIHRSFSILIMLVNLYLLYIIVTLKLGYTKIKLVLLLLVLIIVSGIAMNYFHFPFGSQTFHLVLASLLFGLQFYMVLEASYSTKKMKSL